MSADRLWENPTTDLEAEAEEIVAKAKEEHKPSRTIVLFSGGNDSLVLLDAMAKHADEVAHVNTDIGIEDTTDFARKVGASYGLPYSEWTPPIAYEDLVLGRWDGMPGPGAHRFTFTMLKERCVEAMLRTYRRRRGERFLLLTGARVAESRRRMGTSRETHRKGGQVWVNPLLWWGNDEMHRYRQERELPVNPVSANLHMSGECLCGAMADQGVAREERAMIRSSTPTSTPACQASRPSAAALARRTASGESSAPTPQPTRPGRCASPAPTGCSIPPPQSSPRQTTTPGPIPAPSRPAERNGPMTNVDDYLVPVDVVAEGGRMRAALYLRVHDDMLDLVTPAALVVAAHHPRSDADATCGRRVHSAEFACQERCDRPVGHDGLCLCSTVGGGR